MRQLKYNGDISKYLARLKDLNQTVGLTGQFLKNLVFANVPRKIFETALNSRKNPLLQDDKTFLEAVLDAGRVYESTLAQMTQAGDRQSGSAKEQSRTDRRRERTSPSRSSVAAKKRRLRASKSSSSKGPTWSSKKEALQGIAQANIDKRKKSKVSCLRCGRDSHDTLDCFAKRDVDGKDLPSAPAKAPEVAGSRGRQTTQRRAPPLIVSRSSHRARRPRSV